MHLVWRPKLHCRLHDGGVLGGELWTDQTIEALRRRATVGDSEIQRLGMPSGPTSATPSGEGNIERLLLLADFRRLDRCPAG